jgi:NADH:ubiquinone oxidoreductase subunit 6 (subunit J)
VTAQVVPAPGRGRPDRVGLALCVVSAAGFGSLAVFGKQAYAGGLGVVEVLALRFGIAGPLLVALAAAITVAGNLPNISPNPDLGVAPVGRALFGPLLVAFELTAPLLLVAILGAVVVWRRHEPRSRLAAARRQPEPRRVVMR